MEMPTRIKAALLGAALAQLCNAAVMCSLTAHQRDPRTIECVRQARTIASEDSERAERALLSAATLTARPEDAAALRRDAGRLAARRESAGDFFDGWLFREEQKSE